MSNTAQLKKVYAEQIAPALMKQFNYSSKMQIPVLKKIVINQGLGVAVADKKIIDVAINESSLSVLVSLLIKMSVFAVPCTLSDSPAKPRYSSSDCTLNSMRSSKNTTLSASPDEAINCADLNEVIVLPDPVVCQMYPPRCWWSSQLVRCTTSLMRLAAKY